MRWRAAGLAAVLLAACNGGGDTATSTSASTAPTTTGATSSPTAGGPATAGVCWSAPITPDTGTPAFEDATASSGLEEPLLGMYGHAAAVADVDDDGWLDLFVGTFGDRPTDDYRVRGADGPAPDRLLLGGPDGFHIADGFPEVRGRTSGAVFADLDGDGDPDLVAARNVRDGAGDNAEIKSRPTTVYSNEGDGRFEEVATLLPTQSARAVAPLDFDDDGNLDLFVSADGSGASSALLHNDGDWQFTDVTREAGLPEGMAAFGVTATDLTGDGVEDLVLAGTNRVFVGTGSSEFEDATPDGFDWETFGDEDLVTSVAVGDLDRDGRPDVVVGHHFNSTVDDGEEVPIRVFRNETSDGRLRLVEVTSSAGVPAFPTKAAHVAVADFDNDGWPDILATASAASGAQPAVLHNQGGGTIAFDEVPGLGDPRYWVTGAVADFDRDGRLDIFVVAIDPTEPSLLLRNTGPSGHWLALDLGAGAPSDFVGGRVDVYRTGQAGDDDARLGGGPLSLSTGYAAGAAPIVHVGLGDETAADVVVTRADGDTVEIDSVAADRLIRPGTCD